jgi:hypothetical protein
MRAHKSKTRSSMAWLGAAPVLFTCVLGCRPAGSVAAEPRSSQSPRVDTPSCTAHALGVCRERCASGDGPACTVLLLQYERSEKSPNEKATLTPVFEQACHREKGAACRWLAMRLLEEPGGSSQPRTVELLDRACTLSDVEACVVLGGPNFQHPQVDSMRERVFDAKKRACRLGVRGECREAALFVLEPYEYEGPKALALRASDALDSFVLACQAGDTEACSYAVGLSDSEGLPTYNVSRALELLDRACLQGNGESCKRAAARRWIGRGTPASPEAAMERLTNACAAGLSAACQSAEQMTAVRPSPSNECQSDEDCMLGSLNCDIWCSPCWRLAEGLGRKWAEKADRACTKSRVQAYRAAARRPTCARCPPPRPVSRLLQPAGVACIESRCVAF